MVLDPREYKGTNYTPCIATSFVANLSLTPMVPDQNGRPTAGGGFFDPVHCDAEIAEIAAAGLNSIRIVGSFYGWLVDRQSYMDSLKVLCRTCWQYGVFITYCLWNSTQWGMGTLGGGNLIHDLLRQSGFPLLPRNQPIMDLMFQGGLVWLGNQNATPDANITQYPEPVPDEVWDPGRGWDLNLLNRIEEYLKEVCRFFDSDADGRQAIGSLDLYNEAEAIWAPGGGLPHQPQRLAPVMSFIRLTHDRARRYAPRVPCTIGWAGLDSPQVPEGNYALAANLGIVQD